MRTPRRFNRADIARIRFHSTRVKVLGTSIFGYIDETDRQERCD